MDVNTVPNTSKRPRNNNLDLVDRISALPDFILGDILSFLPANDAVATSILSKRWKSAWVMNRNLIFYHNDLEEHNDMEFIEFVNRVFLLHDAGPLNKFHLNWVARQPILTSCVSSWINTAITRNIQELYLGILIPDGKFEVPSGVFSCASLRCLELYDCCVPVSASIVVCLERLATLKLFLVEFKSHEVFEKLINGCPMLNYLHLIIQPGDFTYIISSTSLRRLNLYCMYNCTLNLKLEASSLEYLKLHGSSVPKTFVLKSLSSHVEVDFLISLNGQQHLQANVCDSVVGVVSALYCAKALTLSAVVIWALSHSTVKLSTKFNRLVKLKTDIRCCDWRSLQDLIQRSDHLQVLTIYQDPKLRGIDHHNRSKWTTPAQVPRCLSMSLKKIVFDNYHGNVEDENEMIRYMLTHGSVLEVMRITFDGNMNSSKFKSVQKIGEYPRKSPLCVVKFFGSTSNNNAEVCFTAQPLI